jgi:hypothetical protein
MCEAAGGARHVTGSTPVTATNNLPDHAHRFFGGFAKPMKITMPSPPGLLSRSML